ncbi:MAG TPA: hypothetical protein VGJ26_16070, partial [Pirellulales bacterium]
MVAIAANTNVPGSGTATPSTNGRKAVGGKRNRVGDRVDDLIGDRNPGAAGVVPDLKVGRRSAAGQRRVVMKRDGGRAGEFAGVVQVPQLGCLTWRKVEIDVRRRRHAIGKSFYSTRLNSA